MSKLLEVFKNRNHILEGIKNNIFKKDHVEAVYNERLNICKSCHNYDTVGVGCSIPGTAPCCNVKIDGCGCSLSIKLRALHTDCPLGKWKAVVTEEESIKIQNQIKDDSKDN